MHFILHAHKNNISELDAEICPYKVDVPLHIICNKLDNNDNVFLNVNYKNSYYTLIW